ncbi:MAG: 4Fe-4S dicluster domain-containing protein, partial [Eubacterium sp.]
ISFMKDFQPLTQEEHQAVEGVTEEFHKLDLIPCTSCHYCVEENHCPKEIRIPDMFACLNKANAFHEGNMDFYYNNVLTIDHGKASDCIKCGGCERVCPQHLEIRKLLEDVAAEFEGNTEK